MNLCDLIIFSKDNSDEYITNEMRYTLCKQNVKIYDENNKLSNLKEVFDLNFAHRIKFSK
jgi:hypothetical protein